MLETWRGAECFPVNSTPIRAVAGAAPPTATAGWPPAIGADLSAATTLTLDADHPTLRAQDAIDIAVDSGAADIGIYREHPVADFLTDLKALGARALSSAAAGLLDVIPADLHEAYRSTPSRTRPAAQPLTLITAVALTAARAILCHDDHAVATDMLARLEKPIERNGASLDWPRAGWASGTTSGPARCG